MIKVKQAVIVEGKYDKIKLSSVIDGLIITTDGFSIFKNKEKLALIRRLSEKQGIIILTDSDSAGFKIRNYIRGCTQKGKITNIYIPDIFGKEKRKTAPSKEGKLGVEGIPVKVLKEAFEKAGITSENTEKPHRDEITRIMLYDDMLMGREGSEEKRKKLLKKLSLPEMLSVNSLLEVLNSIYSLEEYKNALKEIE
ncbi:MAG TPA: DUF4093 domain-containing protein [Ruminococcaceae bacterium]|nr:DUF4093 domain-containing protein [Oscillospiraceae bacterium]